MADKKWHYGNLGNPGHWSDTCSQHPECQYMKEPVVAVPAINIQKLIAENDKLKKDIQIKNDFQEELLILYEALKKISSIKEEPQASKIASESIIKVKLVKL